MSLNIQPYFDQATFSMTYVISCDATGAAAIIDPVLDYDAASGATSRVSADKVVDYVRDHDLDVKYIMETHVHADHISAAPYLKKTLGGITCIGEHVKTVQETFAPVFNLEPSFKCDGSQFDRLLSDGDELELGEEVIRVLHTPGHTPACVTYMVGDAMWVGDTFFMPDFGTARCDFPGGDAAVLCASLRKILSQPDETRMFMCHDYAPGGRDYEWETTVGEQRAENIHIGGGKTDAEFIKMRSSRDKELSMPKLILPSVQVNMRAGFFPPAEGNGVSYLKIPIDQF